MSYEVVKWSTDVSMAKLREWFPDGGADELNFVLFSTSGIHGHYCTIEACEASVLGGSGEGIEDVTFLVVMPRAVHVNYGNCAPRTAEDFAFLKKLRASSHAVVAAIGVAPQEASKLAATEIDLPTDHDVLEHCDQNGTTLAEAAFALAKPSKEAGKVEAVADEREAFEADYLNRFGKPGYLGRDQNGKYGHNLTQTRWEGWQARASLYLRPSQQALSDPTIAKALAAWFNDDGNGTFEERMRRAILAAAGGSEK